ncbi:aminoacyl-histidine dipeptidase [Actinobacillus succinogenes]|nr:aminoacyl-histidine dipeptidase [Actinobacillus succinogenes]PHI39979.1 aminoacyl-histidine dipeptidase [Actinobacillus succinogenes]
MSEIQTLQPARLWQWFDKICAIPHPSYHEDALAEFIVNWAKGKNLFAERDEAGNVLIRKAATQGMENRPSVALQAHLDMVPQANESTRHDFLKDPILPRIEGDWVYAAGTTLGADNGIGMASSLAVLDSDDLAHPELEVLLTMTEEAGMEGALGLRAGWLRAKMMVNTDTEESGEIYIGCAGGENADFSLPVNTQPNKFPHCFEVAIKGLRGGHSGCDIHTGRGNAIKLLGVFLTALSYATQDFAIVDIRGGSVRNAIPREAFVTLALDDADALNRVAENFKAHLKAELTEDPNAQVLLNKVALPQQTFDTASSQTVTHVLNALPNGVVKFSDTVKDVVETSLSIGVLNMKNGALHGTILLRSLIEHGTDEVKAELVALAQQSGGDVAYSGYYPGWEPHPDSDMLTLTKQAYAQVIGEEPKVKVIHAGLECGLLKKIYPELDVVSIGPTIRNAHSPDECVHIPAVQTYWSVLTQVLAGIKEK